MTMCNRWVPISDGLVNSTSQKIHTRWQCFTFDRIIGLLTLSPPYWGNWQMLLLNKSMALVALILVKLWHWRWAFDCKILTPFNLNDVFTTFYRSFDLTNRSKLTLLKFTIQNKTKIIKILLNCSIKLFQ